MYCPNCGKQNDDNATACTACDSSLEPVEVTAAETVVQEATDQATETVTDATAAFAETVSSADTAPTDAPQSYQSAAPAPPYQPSAAAPYQTPTTTPYQAPAAPYQSSTATSYQVPGQATPYGQQPYQTPGQPAPYGQAPYPTPTSTTGYSTYQPYGAAQSDASKNWGAVVGLVLGILGIVVAWYLSALLGGIIAAGGIACSAMGLRSAKRGLAIGGLICSIIGAVLGFGYYFVFLVS